MILAEVVSASVPVPVMVVITSNEQQYHQSKFFSNAMVTSMRLTTTKDASSMTTVRYKKIEPSLPFLYFWFLDLYLSQNKEIKKKKIR